MSLIQNIAFFGSSEIKEKSHLYKQVFRAAQTLAKNSYVIVDGGGPGVMDAATQGAESVNGETISITFSPKNATGFEGRYPRNITDKEIKTGNYIERMFKLLEQGDLYIIFKGGTGTLSEFSTAWCLARLYFGYHKPFILFGSFWKEIIEVLKKNLFIRDEAEDVFKIVSSTQEILEAVKELEKKYHYRLKNLKTGLEGAFMLGYQGPDFKLNREEKK